ncbi:class I SAM-dependent methyltransferase [Planomonospora sp. ID67723]|uniref:class I SAM-dependent methyltransferase n=1 Tax=Planomonospora sp. ID67723 TaxID=2738134 RepID=UPI0018C3982B|nr:class I SAM-dependent methyltransferase [Planomonospora sp. ID67723]MBG0832706.1 class I SAM-dependent methyltransferase [Planomonospora sp. ID67723]
MASDTASLDPDLAKVWLDRWDAQQERYVADRERRFAVIGEVLAHALSGCARPLVLDVGCGPGSLAGRTARRLPSAQIVGVDNDPLLLALARSAYPTLARFVEADLRLPGWSDRLGLDRDLDAAVSSTALHYLPVETLAETYRELARRMRPGGILVNADNLYDEQPAIAGVAAALRRTRLGDGEDWTSWWRAVAAEPALAELVARRRERATGGGDHRVSVSVHDALLRRAGFGQVGPVWQNGDDVVLVAVRSEECAEGREPKPIQT